MLDTACFSPTRLLFTNLGGGGGANFHKKKSGTGCILLCPIIKTQPPRPSTAFPAFPLRCPPSSAGAASRSGGASAFVHWRMGAGRRPTTPPTFGGARPEEGWLARPPPRDIAYIPRPPFMQTRPPSNWLSALTRCLAPVLDFLACFPYRRRNKQHPGCPSYPWGSGGGGVQLK